MAAAPADEVQTASFEEATREVLLELSDDEPRQAPHLLGALAKRRPVLRYGLVEHGRFGPATAIAVAPLSRAIAGRGMSFGGMSHEGGRNASGVPNRAACDVGTLRLRGVAKWRTVAASTSCDMRSHRPRLQEELAATRKVRLEPVARGLEQITDVQLVSGTPRTAVVLEKAGRAKVVELGEPTGSDVRNAAGALVLFEVEVESSR